MSTVEPGGHVAVRPRRRLAVRRAGRVPRRVLDEQHVRPLRVRARRRRPPRRRRSRRACRRDGPSPRGAAPSAAHGTGPSSAQSTLNTPGAVAEPLGTAADPRRRAGRRRSPRAWRGVTSRSVARAGGQLVERRRPRWSVTISPPSVAQLGGQGVGDGRPPRRGPSASRRRGRRSRGRARTRHSTGDRGASIECAATPAKSARAGSSRNADRARPSAERRAGRPNRASSSGMPRARGGRAGAAPAPRSSARADERPEEPPPRPAVVRRRDRPRSPRPTAPGPRLARRRGGGRTAHRGGRTRRRGPRRSTVRKNGEARASGRIVEQTSWRNPGSVSSSVRVPPPTRGAAS